jgi:endonuclease-8
MKMKKGGLLSKHCSFRANPTKFQGITVDLELYEQLKDIGLSRGQARHWVFTRNDRPCHQCGELILHTRPGGRRLDYCPTCQS